MKMINKGLVLVLILFSILSCNKEKTDLLVDGEYSGTFSRVMAENVSPISNIEIVFSKNSWNGSSDIIKYPGLCNGSYEIQADTIIFDNFCAWTAEFDWSLILSGKYLYKKTGNSIEFSREALSGIYIDRYILVKKE